MYQYLKVGILVVFLLFMGGCSKRDVQGIVLDTFDEWKTMYVDVWIDLSSEGEIVKINGSDYCKVRKEGITSLADMKEKTEAICTKKGAKELFYDYYLDQLDFYVEKDGVLYVQMAAIVEIFGSRDQLKEFRVLEENDNYIHAEMLYELDDFDQRITMELINSDGKWKVDSLEENSTL